MLDVLNLDLEDPMWQGLNEGTKMAGIRREGVYGDWESSCSVYIGVGRDQLRLWPITR